MGGPAERQPRDYVSQTPSVLVKIVQALRKTFMSSHSVCVWTPLNLLLLMTATLVFHLSLLFSHSLSFSLSLLLCPVFQHIAAQMVANWCRCSYSIFLCLHLQFNCTYSQAEDAPPHFPWPRLDIQHESVENVTFSMELYNTSLFRHSQPPSLFQVMENKPIFVEVIYSDNSFNTPYA